MAMGYPVRPAIKDKFLLQAAMKCGGVTTKGWSDPAQWTAQSRRSPTHQHAAVRPCIAGVRCNRKIS